MRQAKVIKAFPFAFDGINVSHLSLATPFPPEGQTIADSAFDGLVAAGYLEEVATKQLPAEEQLNRDILDAFDRKLLAASDQELKDIIARSGTPYSGNMVHARLVFAAKQQMLRELQGETAVLGINPNAGVTEQPLSKPGEATPPSAAAAVECQNAQQEAAAKAAAGNVGGENKATNQFGDPLPGGGAKTADAKLDEMTVAELKEHAASKKIELGDATKKADIIAAIKAG